MWVVATVRGVRHDGRGRLAWATRRIVPWRYVVLVAVAVAVFVHTVMAMDASAGADWYLFTLAADHLTSVNALHAFASTPDLQTGPLSVVAVVALRRLGPANGWLVTSALLFCLALVLVRICERAASYAGRDPQDRAETVTLIGGCFLLLSWTGPAGWYGHADDVLALVAIAGAVLACAKRRWLALAVAVGLAAAFKPWGFCFLPLAAVVAARRVRGVLVALAVGGLPWLPFVIADHQTLRVLRFDIAVAPASSLRALGFAVGSRVMWAHGLQFLVAWVLGAIAIQRARWMVVPWLAMATRVNLEPGAFFYYGAGPMCGALVLDLMRPGRIPGGRTATTWLLLYGVRTLATALGAGPTEFDILTISGRLVFLGLAIAELARPNAIETGAPARLPLLVRRGSAIPEADA